MLATAVASRCPATAGLPAGTDVPGNTNSSLLARIGAVPSEPSRCSLAPNSAVACPMSQIILLAAQCE